MGAQPTKPKVTPSVKMKQLHWQRIILPANAPAGEKPIWSNLTEVKFDVAELEQTFAAQQTKVKVVSEDKAEEKTEGPVRVLDDKRSQNMAIMLAHLPPLPVVVAAIKEADAAKLSQDDVMHILEGLPTPEEVGMVKEALAKCADTGGRLDRPEQFVHTIGVIPCLRPRLDSWLFERTFAERLASVTKPLQLGVEACAALQSSQAIAPFLSCVVSVGNYLNGGTARGQADGFDLDFLEKLCDTKGGGDVTLLEHCVILLQKHAPKGLALDEELHVLLAATRISTDDIQAQVAKLGADLGVTSNKLKAVTDAATPSDPFPAMMSKFVGTAEKEVKQVKDTFETYTDEHKKVFGMFMYGKKKPKKPEDLFRLWAAVIQPFKTYKQKHTAPPKEEAKAESAPAGAKRGVAMPGLAMNSGAMKDCIAQIKMGTRRRDTKAFK
mmetsp:Transcript_15476/g.36956  ORF Transcript_15476/g.36956 Transcript_15476/m.36956 type:complete len:438 (+) Transcript_15476:3-1316(+)